MSAFTVTIPGEPHAQGRARTRIMKLKNGGQRPVIYDPKESRDWKATAQQHMRDEAARQGYQLPIIASGPVCLEIEAYFTCPQGDYRKTSPRPVRRHTKKPDRDNVEKAIKDAAKGVLWLDDSQVCDGTTRKFIAAQGDSPRIVVRIYALPVEVVS
jgi:Holliday junction resolvase RusA-like endonuclease